MVCSRVAVRCPACVVVMRRVRSPTPRSGLAGRMSSESIRRSPSAISPSGSARNSICQSPAAFRNCGSDGTAPPPLDQAAQRRPRVQLLQLLGQRLHRLLLKNGDNPFQPRVLVRVQVDGVPAGREGRVLQLLEVLPHVLDDRVDDIPGRPAGRGRRPRPFVEPDIPVMTGRGICEFRSSVMPPRAGCRPAEARGHYRATGTAKS